MFIRSIPSFTPAGKTNSATYPIFYLCKRQKKVILLLLSYNQFKLAVQIKHVNAIVLFSLFKIHSHKNTQTTEHTNTHPFQICSLCANDTQDKHTSKQMKVKRQHRNEAGDENRRPQRIRPIKQYQFNEELKIAKTNANGISFLL